uniref:hypothetical protein n=1 Tax=Pedobacter schmidteae TaxID=2201271 RepID=UPI0013CF1F13|nr:hypothetical protein [Pedobacter schmidteae]
MRKNDEVIRRLFKLLCGYKQQSPALREYLSDVMQAGMKIRRTVLVEHQSVMSNSIFVSDGYIAIYGFDAFGHRQVLSIIGKDSIIASKSFMEQSCSEFEYVALPGAYLATISFPHLTYIFEHFEGTEELARMIIANNAEREQKRLHSLRHDAETVILEFYNVYPEFLKSNMMFDSDLASYLLISEKTLRNVRMKLFKEGKLTHNKRSL